MGGSFSSARLVQLADCRGHRFDCCKETLAIREATQRYRKTTGRMSFSDCRIRRVAKYLGEVGWGQYFPILVQ